MSTKIRNFLLTALSGYAVCIILGLLVFGTSIFAFHYILFIITAFGFYGAVFYSVLKYFKIKNQILICSCSIYSANGSPRKITSYDFTNS